ncbi:Ppx/GppA phosphatase family protein [Synechococcus sp. PCC 7336]|uniref:Ppx/GppA phosphatase family protein n=1 Tax=Synechococcus sp. PCC 7336 TaxID=195250 RepID=UPI00034BE066|nr:Ppx/GppA phosphatase family protein [Synechococcus sp. PCC 7336]
MVTDTSLVSLPTLTTLTIQEQRVMAAIDVGTNSIHTLIVKVDPAIPSFMTIAKDKATIRLGETDPETGCLTPEAMQRGFDALERSRALAQSYRAEAIVAVATSAVREAPNGHVFLERVLRELGIEIDLISGREEARRIYLGVLSAVALNDRPHVIIDIGGGSTELILGTGEEPLFLRSLKLGAVRLTQQFISGDPPSSKDFHHLQGYVRGKAELPAEGIRDLLHKLAPGEPVRVIGTSGTIEALAMVSGYMHEGPPASLQGYSFELDDLRKAIAQMRKMTVAERSKMPGLSERRAEIIVAGAAVLLEILERLGASEISVCERALREGLIVDWMLNHDLIEDRLQYQSQVRQRHIYRLAKKYRVDILFAERVADLALSLFDQMGRAKLHQWGARARELLWAAAILHSCGHFVSHSAHHKHTYYLIRNGELLGFTEEEIETIANLARYHRKSTPKKRHEGFQNLPDDNHRQMVSELSPLLRLATALHRRPTPAILSVDVEVDDRAKEVDLRLTPIRSNDDCSLELWALDFKKSVFEQQFGYRLSATLLKKRSR